MCECVIFLHQTNVCFVSSLVFYTMMNVSLVDNALLNDDKQGKYPNFEN